MTDDSTNVDEAWAVRLERLRRGVGLRLDAAGKWWQGDEPFLHAGLIAALNRGIRLHPDSGEPIVYIGDKWCYFESEDLPLVVRGLQVDEHGVWALLNTEARVLIPRDGFYEDGDRILIRLDAQRTARLSRTTQSLQSLSLRTSQRKSQNQSLQV